MLEWTHMVAVRQGLCSVYSAEGTHAEHS